MSDDVLAGRATWSCVEADCLAWLRGLPADGVDLVFGSPPYEAARSYGIGFNLRGQAWVDWMVEVFRESVRVCKGLVAFVLEGQTKGYRWSASPALLMADLHRAGVVLRKPPIYRRVGIPGSGGPDWLRNDYEWVVCATRGGKLPWSDNTACGHPPKWAPGGEMSHRLADGARVNQWGMNVREDGTLTATSRGSDVPSEPSDNLQRRPVKPSHRVVVNKASRRRNGSGEREEQDYVPPAIANPGNVIDCRVGGGQMGNDLASQNEAPFPETLAEFFVRSFCPPGGVVADCFSGSGTTGACAVRRRRRFVGCDVRASQVELTRRRLSEETPMLFAEIT